MSEDRETDRLLGQLLADGKEHARQLEALFRRFDGMLEKQTESFGVAKEALRVANEVAKELKEEIHPTVADYKALKAKGAGVLGAVAVLGGGVATVAQKAWTTVMGTH